MNKEVQMTADIGMRQRGMAFPLPMSQIVYPNGCSRGDSGQYGMTLRQWYAGMIVQGMNASPELMQLVTSKEGLTGHFPAMAKASFMLADAMIAFEENQYKTETPDV